MDSPAATMNEKASAYIIVENKTKASDSAQEAARLLHVFRGPVLLSLVLVPLISRYSFQLSSGTILSITILVVGAALTCHDLFLVAEQELRHLTQQCLNAVILDDVLRGIFDPQVGLVATITATIIGNAFMYTLPMSKEQRIELLQSCLLTSEQETSEILMAPGGVRQLLPGSVQGWLVNAEQQQQRVIADKGIIIDVGETDKKDHEEGEDSPTDSDTDCETIEKPMSRKLRSKVQFSGKKPFVVKASPQQATTDRNIPQFPPSDPLIVMGKILKELSMDGIQSTIRSIPDSWLEGASIAGTLALCLQLRASPRARHAMAGFLEGTTAMGFAGVALGGISALLAKQSAVAGAASSTGREPAVGLPSRWTQMILNRVKAMVSHCKNSTQLQAAIAFLALYYVGRVRRRYLTSSSSRRY